ncbi:hypothetical protein PMZ80_001808 [Knufia obscura]|uniref:Uncharacterized protein n=2 Tax=Knufia TaxID=430999 RepID=A0AAN8ECT5_9EURO|nr:hypothetical protein PMZ80_001808 [Knufia obscura]KAK5948338.1 hypothetical protein OHC33_010648 [Knufia fluminis]
MRGPTDRRYAGPWRYIVPAVRDGVGDGDGGDAAGIGEAQGLEALHAIMAWGFDEAGEWLVEYVTGDSDGARGEGDQGAISILSRGELGEGTFGAVVGGMRELFVELEDEGLGGMVEQVGRTRVGG